MSMKVDVESTMVWLASVASDAGGKLELLVRASRQSRVGKIARIVWW
jgi:hypothetical protein